MSGRVIELVEDTRTPLEVAIFYLKRGDTFEQIKTMMQSQYKITHYDFVCDIVENKDFQAILSKMQQNRRFEMIEYAERCLHQKVKNNDLEASAFVLERVGGKEWKSQGKTELNLVSKEFSFKFSEDEKEHIRNSLK
jgi:hypothetical protein